MKKPERSRYCPRIADLYLWRPRSSVTKRGRLFACNICFLLAPLGALCDAPLETYSWQLFFVFIQLNATAISHIPCNNQINAKNKWTQQFSYYRAHPHPCFALGLVLHLSVGCWGSLCLCLCLCIFICICLYICVCSCCLVAGTGFVFIFVFPFVIVFAPVGLLLEEAPQLVGIEPGHWCSPWSRLPQCSLLLFSFHHDLLKENVYSFSLMFTMILSPSMFIVAVQYYSWSPPKKMFIVTF